MRFMSDYKQVYDKESPQENCNDKQFIDYASGLTYVVPLPVKKKPRSPTRKNSRALFAKALKRKMPALNNKAFKNCLLVVTGEKGNIIPIYIHTNILSPFLI